MNDVKSYEIKGKYNIKVYMGNYDKKEFYSQMGEFFADRNYRKKLPYLINDVDKMWYLVYERSKFAGFFGIKICNQNTLISDVYIDEKYEKSDVFEYMTKYLVNLYNEEEIKVLTKTKKEQETLINFGFEKVGNRGNYAVMTRSGKK